MTITEKQLLEMPAREFTMTETLDCETAIGQSEDWLFMEDAYVVSCLMDRLEAVGDNLYRIRWGQDREEGQGDFTLYSSLSIALRDLLNANPA